MWGRSKKAQGLIEEGTRTLLSAQNLALSIAGQTIRSLTSELEAIKAHDKAQGIELKRVQDELTAHMEFQRMKEASWFSYAAQQAQEIRHLTDWNEKLKSRVGWQSTFYQRWQDAGGWKMRSGKAADLFTELLKHLTANIPA